MIQADGISYAYGKHEIIRSLSFRVDAGECLVMAGPNGSGKSTALSVLSGVLKPSSGSVRADGAIGYVPQGSALLEDATVEENLQFFARLAKSRVPDTLPFSVERYRKKKVSRLSGGMKKQVSIACALLGDPSILLLDEPCAALDIAFRDEMIDHVAQWKQQGKTIVYVGHDPTEFYSFFDTVLFFTDPPRIQKRSELFYETKDAETFSASCKNVLSNHRDKGESQ